MPVDIADVLRTRLRPLADEPPWSLWQHKTLNIHRGVLWRQAAEAVTCAQIAGEVRDRVAASYRVSWWRGFGFGAVVEAPDLPADADGLIDAIDTQGRSRGTWQWAVLASANPRAAVGVHTWKAGYLTPVYEGVLAAFAAGGYEVAHCAKEKDALLRFLEAVSRLRLPGLLG